MAKLTGMSLLWHRLRDVAEQETRTVILQFPQGGLPPGAYAFVEFYCDDPACDCRRVLLQVWPNGRTDSVLATINYGWESEGFYAQWLHGDRKGAREIRKANLDPLNARLQRHYEMFKSALTRPG